jgi:hypothetical protein
VSLPRGVELSEPVGEGWILGAKTIDLGAVDGDQGAVGERTDSGRARAVGREERPFSDHGAGGELTRPFWCLHDEATVDHDEEARAGLAVLDHDFPRRVVDSRSKGFEPAQIVLVHEGEYRTGGA